MGAACYGGIHWYDPLEPTCPARHLGWKGSMLSLDVSPDGRWVAAGCQDASVHVWRLWSGDDLQMAGYPAKVSQVTWDPGSRYMAVGNESEITIWDFAGKGPQGTMPLSLEGHEGQVRALTYDASSALLASGGEDGMVVLWQPPRRNGPVAAFDHDDELSALAWRHDGTALASGTADGTVRILSLSSTD